MRRPAHLINTYQPTFRYWSIRQPCAHPVDDSDEVVFHDVLQGAYADKDMAVMNARLNGLDPEKAVEEVWF
jgi:hypothetical protein